MNEKEITINKKHQIWEDRNLPLELRLSSRMMLSGALAAFAGTIVTLLAHTHWIATMLTIVLAIGIPILYFICVPRKMFRFLRYSMAAGVLIIIPFLWTFGGGLHSGMSLWIIFEILFFAVSLDGNVEKIAISLSIVFYGIVLVLWGLKIFRYDLESEHNVYLSLFGSALVVAGMVVYMTNFQKRLFRDEYTTVNAQNIELKEYAERIEKANNYQKIFLANMSHEIRSPMNVVLGFNRLALESFDVDEIHGYLKTIDTAGESLLVIINDILDYSKIEAGKLELFPAEYNLNELIKQCKSSIDVQCESKGLEFITDVDPTIPVSLFGDSVRLRQCTTNLLTNAMKYTPDGGVYLTFKNGGISEDGSSVKLIISVRDTGQGISDYQMKHLFTRFQRLNENTNRSIEGTGLGLSLTKSLIDMMNGTIDVISTVGKGSIFTITLDQELVKSDSEDRFSMYDIEAETDVSGMKVLVVDDSRTNLILMKKILAKFGIEADIVDSGMKTLDIITLKQFDIIFLDHMMPEMDGVETFKKMHEISHLNKATPIVMLTANAMSGAMEEYLKLGFNGYLSKPCKPEEIKHELIKYH